MRIYEYPLNHRAICHLMKEIVILHNSYTILLHGIKYKIINNKRAPLKQQRLKE